MEFELKQLIWFYEYNEDKIFDFYLYIMLNQQHDIITTYGPDYEYDQEPII